MNKSSLQLNEWNFCFGTGSFRTRRSIWNEREISGINEMEESSLKELLNLQEVVIVPGDSDETPWVKSVVRRDLG